LAAFGFKNVTGHGIKKGMRHSTVVRPLGVKKLRKTTKREFSGDYLKYVIVKHS